MSQNQNTDIEALRAIAIGFTLFHHLGVLLSWEIRGYPAVYRYMTFWGGVDLFFCISGYVIAQSFYKASAANPAQGTAQALIPFWARRAWRLWPAAWTWVGLPLAASLLFNRSGAFGDVTSLFKDGLAAITHVANFHWMACNHYKQSLCEGQNHILSVYWSLSLEEQFYLVFPILMLALRKTGSRQQFVIFSTLMVAQLFLDRANWDPMWATRTDGFLAGMLIANLSTHTALHTHIKPSLGPLASRAVLLLLVCLMAALPAEPRVVSFNTGLLTITCAVLVWLASYNANHISGPLITKFTNWAGSRSYALYLVHMSTYAATREIWFRMAPEGTQFGGSYTARFVITALVITTLAAELTHRFIEVPAREHGKRVSDSLRTRLANRLQASP